ncbi:PREDICTED: vasopressin V1a receptor-like isoform X2 [Dinoponera quadriceps]|uniref:Vasopressin V1a receptor-like isoform X2 n=1 Tax=Dinoponera quadriceps TaxID=609295 RepID=A0A6P3WWJ6_DINQU|nr:PREDICTED: vasopressin V1a receptor-like isoform X2 [Dinoponera quadriceps]
MSDDLNSTSSPPSASEQTPVDGRNEDLAKWEIALLTSIFLITLIGNTLVLLALYARKRRQRRKFSRMYFFILHLCIADLLTGLFDVLPQLAWDITFRFQGGAVLCKLIKFGQPFGIYLSSYILTVAAVDRYYAICHPFSYCSVTSRRSKMMVYVVWLLAVVLCVPQVFIFSYQEISPNVWDCWATFNVKYGERSYVTWYSVTQFLLPFIVLVYTYTRICITIWTSNKMSGVVDLRKGNKASFSQRNRDPFISKALINTVKQTIIVVILYIVTSTPFIGCQLWATWDPGAATSPFHTAAFTILCLLNSLTSCINPWIYFAFNRELRSALTNLFFKRKDYSPAYDAVAQQNASDAASTTSSFISRISRLASSKIFG